LILDASALLATILREPGAERVEQALRDGALISTINVAEVLAKLIDRGFTNDEAVTAVGVERLQVVDFSGEMAVQSGLLRRHTRSKGLSLGDRCCLALGIATSTAVLTADHNWAGIDVGVRIEFLR
jgi:ribonuclease VapC